MDATNKPPIISSIQSYVDENKTNGTRQWDEWRTWGGTIQPMNENPFSKQEIEVKTTIVPEGKGPLPLIYQAIPEWNLSRAAIGPNAWNNNKWTLGPWGKLENSHLN